MLQIPSSPSLRALKQGLLSVLTQLGFLTLCVLPGWAAPEADFFPFTPAEDRFEVGSAIDLRFLNEAQAGDLGRIQVREGRFVHEKTGESLRFWAVNGPSQEAQSPEQLRREARLLAKYGVNLVRVHGPVFDEKGEPELQRVRWLQRLVAAFKAEGIYTHFSIYFPLWFKPKPELAWLPGYSGDQHPFATLMFNPAFQEKYRNWWKALLLSPSETDGKSLLEEPAVFGVELQNEDSFFFWTFEARNLPEPQLQMFESQFASWLKARYGSLETALQTWKGPKLERDAPEKGRIAFRPLWNMAAEKQRRDQDTVAFLHETQTRFYREHRAFLQGLGFKGLVTASNWATANAEVYGPLEKESYTVGDFVDRHGYFECNHKGDFAAWSIRKGHTYSERSALRFDGEAPGKARLLTHPAQDIHYQNLPSMISETTWCRPNRYRGEAPLYFAAYGALQASDAIVHFAFDGSRWQVKPNFWMQQWTLCTPVMMGQFPAAALLYRQGLVEPGAVLADLELNRAALLALKGTPLPQDAAFDELRLADVPQGQTMALGQRLEPLLHYAGRAQVRFVDGPEKVTLAPLTGLVDRAAQQVRASHGQLTLDYRLGLLRIESPRAQGLSGRLDEVTEHTLPAFSFRTSLDLGHLLLVPLDGKPLTESRRMLLQIVSEERPTGFVTEPVAENSKRIVDPGRDPWCLRKLRGRLEFRFPDAEALRIQTLDFNGYPVGASQRGPRLELEPHTLYYLVERD